MYSISDLKKFKTCPRLYFLEKRNPPPRPPQFIRLDRTIRDLAARKLHIPPEQVFIGHTGDAKEKAVTALRTYRWLMKARFEAGKLRVKVPFLHKNGAAWDLYFTSLSLYPPATDLLYYKSVVWVLMQNGVKIRKIQLLHLNETYVRHGEPDPEALFVRSDSFYNAHHHPTLRVREAIAQCTDDPLAIMEKMARAALSDCPEAVYTSHCRGRSTCRFYARCFPLEAQAPHNSILTLSDSAGRRAMWENGRMRLKDAALDEIEGTAQQYAEIMADRKGGQFVDRLALRSWLKRLREPISFLDFEWERYALPPYDGMRPLGVLPFEYSLHVQKQNGTLTHTVFLATHDDRKEIIRSLLQNIPARGSIVAYNATGAEMLRIQELAEQFPEYKEALLKLNERMLDLQIPFMTGMVYDTRLAGHWSLKKIMSLLQEERSYRDLDIQEGMAAVYQWRLLDREEPGVDREAIVSALKAYCSMDTYAMTVVLRWLRSLARK